MMPVSSLVSAYPKYLKTTYKNYKISVIKQKKMRRLYNGYMQNNGCPQRTLTAKPIVKL